MAPLDGLRFLNTRPQEQAGELSTLLRRYGAEVWEFPLLKIVNTVRETELAERIAALTRADYLVFTSANAVRAVRPFVALRGYNLAAIGGKTAQPLSEAGCEIDFIAAGANSESFAGEFIAHLGEHRCSTKALLLRGRTAGEELPRLLREGGMEVCECEVYDARMPDISDDETRLLLETLQIGSIDMLIFSSALAVANFFALLRPETLEGARKVPCAVIGLKTAAAVEEYGLALAVVAPQASIESLVEAAAAYWKVQRQVQKV